MKLPINWLKEFVDIDITPDELAAKLISAGFEVEEIIKQGDNLTNTVTGRITKIERHPNAEKLVICTVDIGGKTVTIVTGATNVAEGNVVPTALDNAILPCGKNIKSSPLRGVMSEGMLCSGEELCIDDSVIAGAEVDGILILPDNTPLGLDIRKLIGLDDCILDISVTPNRTDCQSIYGISREVAALTGKKLKAPALAKLGDKVNKNQSVKVDIIDYDICSRYIAAKVVDVKVAPSPKWMQERLIACGIRPINNIVDITNYVLLEVGQPMHAFDCEYIKGGQLKARHAVPGEQITALDGKVYTLTADMAVIADDERPLAIAGVMGGEESGVTDSTVTVVFEAARFPRAAIRHTSRALGLSSASSVMFSRGLDYASPALGMERALELAAALGCGNVTNNVVDVNKGAPELKPVRVSVAKINALLGISVEISVITDILNALGIDTIVKGDIIECKIPVFRQDIEHDADIAEEIIRYYGYDKLPGTLPVAKENVFAAKPKLTCHIDKVKEVMSGLGYNEAVTYSFINPALLKGLRLDEDDYRQKYISIINPLSEEYAAMRTTMLPNMLNVAAFNQNRKNNDIRFFEVARVYIPKELPLTELPEERTTLAVVSTGKAESFFTLKGAIEEVLACFGHTLNVKRSAQPFLHTGRSADILINNRAVGYFGQIHPLVAQEYGTSADTFVAELNFESVARSKPMTKIVLPPKYQAIERDLAFVISREYSAGEIGSYILKTGGKVLESVELFDIYEGGQIEAGHKSMAYALVFRDADKTLKDEDVAPVINKIVRGLSYRYGAKLRS